MVRIEYQYAGTKHFLTINCPCGTTYGVKLNFRKQYRKDVSIGGFYTTDDEDIGSIDSGTVPTVPINCRISDISLGGLGFTVIGQVGFQVGDTLRIRFTLDKEPPEIIEKEVLVRMIRDNYIGCAFIEESGFTDRTLGFYLLK